jgi:ribosome biogenesis protein Tsr3
MEMERDNTFLSIFLLSVHGEIEQEEDFLNMDTYGNTFYNINDEILDTESPIPMNTTKMIASYIV